MLSHLPGSVASAGCGLLAGAIYRGDFAGTRRWRFPKSVIRLAERLLLPLFSSSPAIRSTATTFESRSQTRASDRPAQAMRVSHVSRGLAFHFVVLLNCAILTQRMYHIGVSGCALDGRSTSRRNSSAAVRGTSGDPSGHLHISNKGASYRGPKFRQQ